HICFYLSRFFSFNYTATTEISTLSLHDALPISAVDHAQRRPIPSDHAGGHRVEDDARSRGPMLLAGQADEVLESHPREKARVRVLLGVRAVHSVDRGRVHDPMGTNEPGQGRCDAVRRVSRPRPAHNDDWVSLSELRGRGVAR